MAACKIYIALVGIITYLTSCHASRLTIYRELDASHFCFRRLTDDGQYGCASAYGGNVGIVHIIESQEDLEFVNSHGPDKSYIPVLPDSWFSRKVLEDFENSKRINGLIVFKTNESIARYSSEDQCPNAYSSIYDDATTDSCIKWNPRNNMTGVFRKSWSFPIIYLKNETSLSALETCFFDFNNETRQSSSFSRRKCAVKIYTPMNAAKNSKTCLRKSELVSYLTTPISFCDPLADQNVVSLLKPMTDVFNSSSAPDNSTILVIARMDSMSMFDGLVPGADSAVSGIVTLLSIANTLAKIVDTTKLQRNVVFALLNGEAFDYIGSSKMADDLLKSRFRYNMSLPSVSHIIEVNQLLLDKGQKWYIHVDPTQYVDANINNTIVDMIGRIGKEFDPIKDKDLKPELASIDLELPPASAQSFMKVLRSIPIIVITNHRLNYTNPYYNSMLDNLDNRVQDVAAQADKLQKLVKALSRTVLGLAMGPNTTHADIPSVEVNQSLIEDLLNCYLENSTCPHFQSVVNSHNKGLLREKPYPLYVSVSPNGMVNQATILTYLSMARLTGSTVDNVTEGECSKQQKTDYSFAWMYGDDANSTGICVKFLSAMHTARSPAYGDNQDARLKYSSWTESVWSQTEMNMFVQPSRGYEITTLLTGIFIFIFSAILTLLVNKNADKVFEGSATPVAC